jgi:nitroimidazol reductase NimA-like FMN-containing flavoprotein (pyridoxamine 5'-phosphate oxidase superfamily)
MRKTNQEITDWSVLEEILSGAYICRVAMMDGNKPYLLPFNYGYRERTLYIHSAPEGKKITLLKQNPHVCFEVEDAVTIIPGKKACTWSTRYRSLVGEGKAEILADPGSKRDGLAVIMAQHGAGELIDFEETQLKKLVILKITITSLTAKQSSNWDSHFTDPPSTVAP